MPAFLRVPSTARLSILAGLLVTLGIAACSDPTASQRGAIVSFAFDGYPVDTLRAYVTREGTIALVEEVLAGARPTMMPIGPIRRGSGFDPRYPFHFIPDSLDLAEVAIELCDGAPMHTLAEVDAFIAGSTGSPGSATATWCPWGGYPIRLERL
jgi:hypothetical protein